MSDARDAFQNLQEVTGRGLDATALYADLYEVERRIARYRTGQMVLSSFAALAVVGGVIFAAMSMPLKDAGPAVPPSPTSDGPTAVPTAEPSETAQLPPDVGPTREPSMSVFGEPYPDGVDAPELVSLLTGGEGGSYLSETDTTYTFGLLRPGPTDGHTVEVPITFSKGDILVMAATHWQCAWIAEYVWASEANDPRRTSTAAAELEKFPDLEVIQTYNPQLGEGDYIPRIVGGDTEFAKRWLNGSCSGF